MASRSRPRSRSEPGVRARPWGRPLLAAAGTAVLLLAPLARAGERSTFALIASPDVRITDVTIQEARRLLLGERRFWSSGLPVTTLVLGTGNPARRFLLESLFHMSEQSYRRHTLGQLYRGELDYAPKVVGSDAEAIAFVAAGHGVVALVGASSLSTEPVQVLRVGGRSPRDDDYPLALAP